MQLPALFPRPSRRQFLAGAAMTSFAFAAGAARPGNPAVVQAPCGRLSGKQADGVNIFRGVPFARAPIGELRFKPPVRPERWTDTRDATRWAAPAMQPGKGDPLPSEDCLYLNVWAPQGSPGPYPVLVWVHGGGFTGGRSFSPDQNGAHFARDGVICVTVAYRLGVFGFLDMEPLLGPAYAGSANNGLLDLIAALQWVRENIAAFGGDPSRVTVAGQSAGAKLTDILLGVPSAGSLFQQAISESGGAERVWQHEEAVQVSDAYGRILTSTARAGSVRDSLTAGQARLLIDAHEELLTSWPGHFPLRPEVDGKTLPQLPIAVIRSGSSRSKRLLIGTNLQESAFFIGPDPDKNPVANQLGNTSLAEFEPVLSRYAKVYPQMTAAERRVRAVTAEEYWVPSIRVADAHVQAGGAAWMYRLDFAETSGRFAGEAYHSLDLPLVWDEPHEQAANEDAEAALATEVHHAWMAFISGQTPAAAGLPGWPPYTLDKRPTVILNNQSRVEDKPNEAELQLWKDFLK